MLIVISGCNSQHGNGNFHFLGYHLASSWFIFRVVQLIISSNIKLRGWDCTWCVLYYNVTQDRVCLSVTRQPPADRLWTMGVWRVTYGVIGYYRALHFLGCGSTGFWVHVLIRALELVICQNWPLDVVAVSTIPKSVGGLWWCYWGCDDNAFVPNAPKTAPYTPHQFHPKLCIVRGACSV